MIWRDKRPSAEEEEKAAAYNIINICIEFYAFFQFINFHVIKKKSPWVLCQERKKE